MHIKKHIHSLKWQFTRACIIFLIPCMVLINVYNIFSLHHAQNETIAHFQTIGQFHMSALENHLSDITTYLYNLLSNDSNISYLTYNDSTKRFYAKQSLFRTLTDGILYFSTVDYLYIYSEPYGEYISSNSSRMNMRDMSVFKNFFTSQSLTDIYPYSKWTFEHIGNEDYLFYFYNMGSGTIGACISIASLTSTYTPLLLSEASGDVRIISQTLAPEYKHKNTVMTFGHTPVIQYTLTSAISDIAFQVNISPSYLNNQYRLQRLFMVCLLLFSVIMLTIFYIYQHHKIFLPLQSIGDHLHQINKGNHEIRISQDFQSTEINELKDTINQMLDTILDLNTQIQNETIKHQRAELNYLKMQIRPHFFLNALTTVSNFAEIGKMQELHEFINYLSLHIRFMFRNNLSCITLDEEIMHLEQYINLQNLRFQNQIFLFIDCPKELFSCLVPPFIIYTFAENTIKHVASIDRLTDMYIKITQEEHLLHIIFEDNGPGFSQDFLETHIERLTEEPTDNYHIGINNLMRVIEILYGDEASIHFANATPQGVSINIRIPVTNKTD